MLCAGIGLGVGSKGDVASLRSLDGSQHPGEDEESQGWAPHLIVSGVHICDIVSSPFGFIQGGLSSGSSPIATQPAEMGMNLIVGGNPPYRMPALCGALPKAFP